MQQNPSKSIIRQIRQDRKPITILFTDIEDSSKYWEKYGDIQGRLIVDQHNRIIFPAIKKHKGKVIKTIGDAVMASFKHPAQALKAAISIQQLLEAARSNNKDFNLKVRIGIHTGEAIIEDNDIFGSAVNLASRIENQAKGNEIAISGEAAFHINTHKYQLKKVGTFLPKGKAKEISLYLCQWQNYQDLSEEVNINAYFPISKKQKIELAINLLCSISALYFIFLYYLRYFISDIEPLALILLNPKLILENYLAIFLLTVTLIGLSHLISKLKIVSLLTMRILKGGLYFCACFLLLFHVEKHILPNAENHWRTPLYTSDHLFAEVSVKNTKIYSQPSINSKELYRPSKGTLLLLNNIKRRHGINWNRVLIGKGEYGWIQRITKNYNGDAIRITATNKFYFKFKDLYILLFSILCFTWGYRNFKIRLT